MHVHVLGICGTFMAGVAQLARAQGMRVSGSDANAWPPMSEQLAAAGIEIMHGYDASHLDPAPDLVVIGNALSRGNAAVEQVLDAGLPYVSGPAWLANEVLQGRPVIAVAGTHGKTTASSLVAHILMRAGLEPGYLIGGVSPSLGVSARLGAAGSHFVIEADEYDSAFFDKRSKFVHYRPQVLVLNNLEYDHADIFEDMAAIRRQFHHLVRTVPGKGEIVSAAGDEELERVLAMGCWSKLVRFGTAQAGVECWRVRMLDASGQALQILEPDGAPLTMSWPLSGRHNALNALAAIAASRAAGVPVATACRALGTFEGVKRRLEVRGVAGGVTIYDDFAHHPTAIAETLKTLRALAGDGRVVALVDLASNTMRMGVHRHTLGPALGDADRAMLVPSDRGLEWEPESLCEKDTDGAARISVHLDVGSLLDACASYLRPGDHVAAMSNASFSNVHARLLERLGNRA